MSVLTSRNTLRRASLVLLVGLCWAAANLTGFPGDYGRLLVASVAFNAIAVLAISTLAGSTGIWSLGHTAFIALGAYACANLAAMHVPIELIVPAVALASALIGYVLGLSAGRFSILYFGLLTLAVALTAMEIIGRLTGLTGGDQGMAVAQLPSWILQRNLSSRDALGLSLVLATTVFLLADFVVNGARGRRWRAVKSHRMASMTLGLVPHRENAQAFALSAAIASVAGAATALAIGYLEPESFNLDAGVMLIAATVIGGIASFWGAILGAA
ncbi:MAG TPA: branched-chain amino acid ABC transporter permease, partial [Ramlibacter sp.]|nr:branched-chain amino acid ABC transporter permease [Ramlibacter sp.]